MPSSATFFFACPTVPCPHVPYPPVSDNRFPCPPAPCPPVLCAPVLVLLGNIFPILLFTDPTLHILVYPVPCSPIPSLLVPCPPFACSPVLLLLVMLPVLLFPGSYLVFSCSLSWWDPVLSLPVFLLLSLSSLSSCSPGLFTVPLNLSSCSLSCPPGPSPPPSCLPPVLCPLIHRPPFTCLLTPCPVLSHTVHCSPDHMLHFSSPSFPCTPDHWPPSLNSSPSPCSLYSTTAPSTNACWPFYYLNTFVTQYFTPLIF